MKNLRLIACLFVATSMFGCAVTTDSSTESGGVDIRIDNATVTHDGELSTINNGNIAVSTLSLSMTSEKGDAENVTDTTSSEWCCTNCNMNTGNCEECHTCPIIIIIEQ